MIRSDQDPDAFNEAGIGAESQEARGRVPDEDESERRRACDTRRPAAAGIREEGRLARRKGPTRGGRGARWPSKRVAAPDFFFFA